MNSQIIKLNVYYCSAIVNLEVFFFAQWVAIFNFVLYPIQTILCSLALVSKTYS